MNNSIAILTSQKTLEIVSLIVTIVCLLSFCVVFTILFRNYYKNNIQSIKDGKDDIELIDNALYEEQQKKNKVKKGFVIAGKVFSWVLLGVIAVGFGFALVSRFSNNNMIIGDSSYIVIATGSMETVDEDNTYIKDNNLTNQINTYDMVEIKKVNSKDDIKLYDVIAFKDKNNRVIVHRVTEILADGTYVTKGDANKVSDNNSLYGSSLNYENIIGKYSGKRIPVMGIFVIFLQSNAGIITIVSIVYCMLMFDYFHSKCEKAIQERTKLLIDTINYDMHKKEADDVTSHFKQSIIYKGVTYIFEDGKFICKDEKPNETEITCQEDDMVVVNEKGNDEKTVTIRNINQDKTKETDKK